MSSRPSILFLAREFTLGGAALLALRHMLRLLSSYDIDLLVTGPCDKSMLKRLPASIQVFTIEPIEPRHSADVIEQVEQVEQLQYQLQQLVRPCYDALLATSLFPDWTACTAAFVQPAKTKLIFIVDEMLTDYEIWFPAYLQRAAEQILLRADLILPVSTGLWQRILDVLPQMSSRPYRVLYPPLDSSQFLSNKRSDNILPWTPCYTPVVLTVARLSAEKQLSRCLRLHYNLRRHGIDFHWYIAGTGALEKWLRFEIHQRGMSDQFHLLGHRDDVHDLIKGCDLFVLFSATEGCPTVVMEALSLGTPVLSSNVNGVAELITHGQTGWITPLNDQSMQNALSMLVQDQALRQQMRQNLETERANILAKVDSYILLELLSYSGTDRQLTQKHYSMTSEQTKCDQTNYPQVTILIPTYNQESFIDQAISSAIAQDFDSLEIIVIDDASTDHTPKLVSRWIGTPRFRYVRNPQRLGRVENYRQALRFHARGEWVLMLDGDDYLTDHTFVREAWQSLQRYTQHRVVFAQAGHVVRTLNSPFGVEEIPTIADTEQLLSGGEYLRFVFQTGLFSHLGTLFHRNLALENQAYSQSIISSDLESMLRLAIEGHVLLLRRVAGCWRQHSANTSSSITVSDIADNIRFLRTITDQAIERQLLTRSAVEAELTGYQAYLFVALFLKALSSDPSPLSLCLKAITLARSIHPGILWSHHFYTTWFVLKFQTLRASVFQHIGRVWMCDLFCRLRRWRYKHR